MTVHALFTQPLFYCDTLPQTGDVTLTGDEAHHVGVQRLRVGDAIAVFDGRGSVARGTIAHVKRDAVQIRVERRDTQPPPAPRVELYGAVPKGERIGVMLDMATQLGMNAFTPLRTRRSVSEPSSRAAERWRRICLEACKQSRRLHLPEIKPPLDLTAAIAAARATHPLLLTAHPAEDARPIGAIDPRDVPSLALFIGPEGGFAPEEVAELRAAGSVVVQLGPAILRIETAAIALLATIRTLAATN